MIDRPPPDRTLSELANAAFAAAAEDVIRRARETGTDIIVWQNGAIVHLSPDEIEQQRQRANQDQH